METRKPGNGQESCDISKRKSTGKRSPEIHVRVLDGFTFGLNRPLIPSLRCLLSKLVEVKDRPGYFQDLLFLEPASFPRADPVAFFDFFKQKTLDQIKHILDEVDSALGDYTHETFTLWHTGIRFPLREQRYTEMETLVRDLCTRVMCLGSEFDFSEKRKLNIDSMPTIYLLDNAMELRGVFVSGHSCFREFGGDSVSKCPIQRQLGFWKGGFIETDKGN